MAITFGELKLYISRRIPISICFRDGYYDDYILISDIPAGKYDDLYVYGIGTVDVEFPLDVYKRPAVTLTEDRISSKEVCFECGLEIVLQEQPRSVHRKDEQMLRFVDLREYLQIGMNFSIVMREDWSAEFYTWKKDIPEQYNDFYVYGIGMDDVSKEDVYFKNMEYDRIKNTHAAKAITIVLSKKPREDIKGYDKCGNTCKEN